MASLIVSALAYPIIQKRFINDPAVFKIAKMRDLVQIQVSATTVGDSQTSPEIAKFTLSLLAAPAGPITGVKVELILWRRRGSTRSSLPHWGITGGPRATTFLD